MHLMTMGFKGITWGVNPTALRLEWARSLRETVLPFAGSRKGSAVTQTERLLG